MEFVIGYTEHYLFSVHLRAFVRTSHLEIPKSQ